MQHAGLMPGGRNATKPRLISEEEQSLNCPRCDSTNTKFCYYNNYNLSQPRHFCKNCRRYWTKGGALRNIPVGGGTRKNSKKSSTTVIEMQNNVKNSVCSSYSSSSSSLFKREPELDGIYSFRPAATIGDDHRLLAITEPFSSLLASHGQIGSLCEPVGMMQAAMRTEHAWEFPDYLGDAAGINSNGLEIVPNGNGGCSLSDPGEWMNGNWPDMVKYMPGSSFQ